MLVEKRRARRFDLSLPVKVMAGGPKKAIPVQTRDISSTGILLEFDQSLAPGTRVELEVTLPGEITQAGPVRVRCHGSVVRSEPGPHVRVAVAIQRYEFVRDRPWPALAGLQ